MSGVGDLISSLRARIVLLGDGVALQFAPVVQGIRVNQEESAP